MSDPGSGLRHLADTIDFITAACEANGLAGVYEYDDGTAYFYLCRVGTSAHVKIIESLQIDPQVRELSNGDIVLAWDEAGIRVGLFAVFNVETPAKFGGRNIEAQCDIPEEERFPLRTTN